MLDMKVQDLRLRGRGFTLYPAAEESGVDDRLMDFLIFAIYNKLELCSGDYEKEKAIKIANPNIPDTLLKDDFIRVSSSRGYDIQDLINADLVKLDGNSLVLTKKTIKILKRAAEIQRELDDEGLSYCPCHHYC